MTDTTNNFQEEKSSSFNIYLFVLQYIRYWYWFVLSIALAISGAYLYLRYTTPIYQINAVLLLKDHPKSVSDKILQEREDSKGNKVVENEIELLKSRSLMLRVVDDLNLTVSYYRQGKVRSDEEIFDTSPIGIYPTTLTPTAYQGPIFVKILDKQQYELQDKEGNVEGKYTFSQNVKSRYGSFRILLKDSLYNKDNNLVKVFFYNREQMAQRYKSILKIVLLNPQSTILKLTIEDAIPAKGRAVLNKLLEAYTYSTLADKNLEASNTIQFINERLRLITGELDNVERNIESYKSKEGITDLSNEGQMFLGAVNVNDTKLNETDIQLKVLDAVENYMKNSQGGFAPAMHSISDPILPTLLQKLGDLQTQQEKYSRTMQAGNPFLQTVTAQITNTKVAIRENVANQRQNLLLSQANLQQQNRRFESSIRTIPRKERESINIKRQQSIKESLYLLLLQKKEEVAISYASAVTDSRVIDDAYSSSSPLKPNRSNIYLVAFLAGLLIPVGVISARMLLSDKVQTRNQIENETGLTVFGEIMRKPKEMNDTIIDDKNNKIISEQFKVLRANLPYADGNITPIDGQLILVTSSIGGEGKSFFSINLASSLAQLEKRVVILETDLRKPKTTTYLGMMDGQLMGITNYLNGKSSINDLIRSTDHPNLFLISSGPIPSNPAELLSSERMSILLKELRQQFDYIILDTPPVAFVADTTILGPYADKVFYLVRHEYTPKNCMNLLTNLAASQKFKSLNVIFNGVAYEKSQEFGYGYGYR